LAHVLVGEPASISPEHALASSSESRTEQASHSGEPRAMAGHAL